MEREGVVENKLPREVEFERKYLEMALERARRLGIHKKAFATMALKGTRKSPERALYAMLGTTSSKKPQNITLREAYKIAEVIELDFPTFCLMVRAELESKKESRPSD